MQSYTKLRRKRVHSENSEQNPTMTDDARTSRWMRREWLMSDLRRVMQRFLQPMTQPLSISQSSLICTKKINITRCGRENERFNNTAVAWAKIANVYTTTRTSRCREAATPSAECMLLCHGPKRYLDGPKRTQTFNSESVTKGRRPPKQDCTWGVRIIKSKLRAALSPGSSGSLSGFRVKMIVGNAK